MNTATIILTDKSEQIYTGVTQVTFDGYNYTVVSTGIEYATPLTADNVASYTLS
jgi:hypothetical protein